MRSEKKYANVIILFSHIEGTSSQAEAHISAADEARQANTEPLIVALIDAPSWKSEIPATQLHSTEIRALLDLGRKTSRKAKAVKIKKAQHSKSIRPEVVATVCPAFSDELMFHDANVIVRSVKSRRSAKKTHRTRRNPFRIISAGVGSKEWWILKLRKQTREQPAMRRREMK